MSRSQRALLIALALLVGGIAWWSHARQETAQRKLEQEIASLRARLEAQERAGQSELPRAIAEGLLRSLPAADSATSALPTPSASAAPAARLSARARSEEMARRLDQLASTERTDPQWSSEASNAARAIFLSVTGSRLQSADCRTSLCRFVVASESLDDQRGMAEQIIGQGPFAGDVWYYYDRESNPPKTTLYAARQGVQLRSVLGDSDPRPPRDVKRSGELSPRP